MDALKILSRSEMRSLTAGSDDICGNVICDVGGTQYTYGYGCDPTDDPADGDDILMNGLDNCELEAAFQNTTCNGCAQFPVAT